MQDSAIKKLDEVVEKSTSIIKAIYGNFSGPKALEIVVSRGKQLELLRPDETT